MNIYRVLHNIKSFPYNIKHGVSNLIKWFPIIWQDRNWDQYYLYTILKYKLELMKHLHVNYGHTMSSKQNAKEIRICINLLDRLIEDEYYENASIEYYKKWGKPKFNWIPVNDENKCSILDITHDKVKTEEDKKQETQEFHGICKHERKMRQQDLEYLFNYMKKHVEGWWD